ncbi:MAG: hypothetical protein O3B75_07265 [Planctomycetota bacterium]|nr:hypothetical protein [Planctomycetota bacterium]
MKNFAKITGSILLLSLAACANTETTTAPGAVSGKSSACCATNKAVACCKENKSATCDKSAPAAAAPAVAAPGAVSGQKKSGCGACPMSGKTNG